MHESWHRTNGVKHNRIVLGEVYKSDANTNTIFADNTKVISLHINTPSLDEGTADIKTREMLVIKNLNLSTIKIQK